MLESLDHPNILPVVAKNLRGEPPWFVAPLAQRSLGEVGDVLGHIAPHGPDLAWVVRDACRGLAHAHENDVIHRDVKPSNILVFAGEGDPFACLSDFGCGRPARLDTSPLTRTGDFVGTWSYASPEQQRDTATVGKPSDVYSLGVVLYEVLSGKTACPAVTYTGFDYAAVPSPFRHVIARACEPKPEDRYPSAVEMLADLEAAIREAEAGPPDDTVLHDRAGVLLGTDELGADDAREAAHILLDHLEDRTLMLGVLPHATGGALAALFGGFPGDMAVVFLAYDALVDGSLPFEYYDVVANFYRRVYFATPEYELRLRILKRLAALGCALNRFYVGRVFAALVVDHADGSLHTPVAVFLKANPDVLGFCRPYLLDRRVPGPIAKLLG